MFILIYMAHLGKADLFYQSQTLVQQLAAGIDISQTRSLTFKVRITHISIPPES